MLEQIYLRRDDPKLFFRLDPGEPGLLRSARASESAIKVTAQEQRNLNRFISEAVREGRQVIFADMKFRYGIDGQFASIRSGHTAVRSTPRLERPLQTANREDTARNDRPDADALRSEQEQSPLVPNQGNNEADESVAVNEKQRTQLFAPSGQNNNSLLEPQLPIKALRINPQRLSISQFGAQTENPIRRRSEQAGEVQSATQPAEVTTHPRRLSTAIAEQKKSLNGVEGRTQEPRFSLTA